MCQRSTAFLSGFKKTNDKLIYLDKHPLACNSFQCPDCAPKKSKVLKARIFSGRINDPTLRKKYAAKLVTLTCPGKDYRENNTPEQALSKMQSDFNKLMTNLRAEYGNIDYFRVTEPQKDKYPHYHVLFVGLSIRPKSFLDRIEGLWRGNYNQGFVKANVVYNFEHGINYLCKYLTKTLKPIKKYQRVFSSSRGAITPMKKNKIDWVGFRNVCFGYQGKDGQNYEIGLEELEKIGALEGLEKVKSYEDLKELTEIIKEGGKKIVLPQV